MKLFNNLFAEKILGYLERTERSIKLFSGLPLVKNHIHEDSFGEHSKGRIAIGFLSTFFVFIGRFLIKFAYVFFMMYLPYCFIASLCPLIALHQETSFIYFFVLLSTICGSLVNTTLFAMGDRDYLMIKIFQISPYLNFLGKLLFKMVNDFVYFFIVLCIFGVSPINSLMLCIITVFSRPVGEMIAIISFDYVRGIYDNRNLINGIIMAVSVLLAYGLPLINMRISPDWIYCVHPFVVCIIILCGTAAIYFLSWYKNYNVLVNTAMHKKRED